jgi:hypothetical protein
LVTYNLQMNNFFFMTSILLLILPRTPKYSRQHPITKQKSQSMSFPEVDTDFHI